MKENIYTSCLIKTNFEQAANCSDKFFESAREEMTYIVDKLNSDLDLDLDFEIGDNKKIISATQIQSLKIDLKRMHIKINLKEVKTSLEHLLFFDAQSLFVINVKLSNINLRNKNCDVTPLCHLKSITTTHVAEFDSKSLNTNRFGKIATSNKSVLEELIRYINALNRAFFVEYELYSYLLLLSYKTILDDE